MKWTSRRYCRGEFLGHFPDEALVRKAKKAVLTTLLGLSRKYPNTDYSTTYIVKNTPESPNYYGKITSTDFPKLIDEKYVESGIILKVVIRKGDKDVKQSQTTRYSVNPKKFRELEKILKEL